MSTAATASAAPQARPGTRTHRPTTYSGISPSAQTASQHPHVTSSSQQGGGPPIPPPPRTSSQRQTQQPIGSGDRGRRDEGNGTSQSRKDNGNGSARGGSQQRSDQRPSSSRRAAGESSASQSGSSSQQRRERRNEDPATAAAQEAARRRRREEEEARNGGHHHHVGNDTLDTVNTQTSQRSQRKELRFGDYILGQTLGEGEFGKVKLGWRRDGGVQVAIKLIRRDTLTPHPNRLSKIHREISILRELHHPNIVRLHEMVETERHIGIILEYASGGELFDFILKHKYLKDPPACRLFAQLVSGVGYLHKKGIVHRDLKLENLLLDRNRNIIITDFGFANVFNPADELSEEVENKLDNPEVLKQLEKEMPDPETGGNHRLWKELLAQGQVRRRGDLMATSCGSPCYAAPELVVSDGLYTGRKVDVWSCGVILYAMLAGYLPFDDDPANPDGDNINLLYKYIVSTPLAFPDYVSPHARDLLRRILVPDPRKRADLFEVARHSWLSPYANVVSLITSGTTRPEDIANTTVSSDAIPEGPSLTRSASVREPSTTSHPHTSVIATREHTAPSQSRPHGDAKRRTVQVEYTEPTTSTRRERPREERKEQRRDERREEQRTQPTPAAAAAVEDFADKLVPQPEPTRTLATVTEQNKGQKMPQAQKARPVTYQYIGETKPSRRPSTKDRNPPAPTTTVTLVKQGESSSRPGTEGGRLPSRGSYTKPSAPSAPSTVTATASGTMQQPTSRSGKTYIISNPIPQPDLSEQIVSTAPTNVPKDLPQAPKPTATTPTGPPVTQPAGKGHKRANTLGSQGADKFFGRFSIFGGSSNSNTAAAAQPAASGDGSTPAAARMSIERSPRHSYDRKGKSSNPPISSENKSRNRRFSLLPASFSLRSMGGSSSSNNNAQTDPNTTTTAASTTSSKQGKHERRPSRSTSGNSALNRRQLQEAQHASVVRTGNSSYPHLGVPTTTQTSTGGGRYSHSGGNSLMTASDTSLAAQHPPPAIASAPNMPLNAPPPADSLAVTYPNSTNGSHHHSHAHTSPTTPTSTTHPLNTHLASLQPSSAPPTTRSRTSFDNSHSGNNGGGGRPAVLTKNRKFSEAYEEERAGHAGSSSAARKVMDFFRKRGIRKEGR